MSKIRLRAWVPHHGMSFDDGYLFEVDRIDLKQNAAAFAGIFHAQHDGWEASWPVTFHIAKDSGEFLGEIEVEREMVPHFVSYSFKSAPEREPL